MDIILKDFEGPLDLLLHLVSRYKMDVYDVPIVDVIEQYLSYIETLQVMRLEVAGEYMVMASQLMLIKSRKLLPKVVDSIIEEDPELELLSQIEEYSRFKEVSHRLNEQHEKRAKNFSKEKQEILVEEAKLAHDKTVMDIFLVFSQVISRQQHKIQSSKAIIEKEDYKIDDLMISLKTRLSNETELLFTTFLNTCESLYEMVSSFLALLELVKIHEVSVEQKEEFSDILIRKGQLWTI